MGKIINSPKGVKAGVAERVSISCPICGTRHDPLITGNKSCVTAGEQTLPHISHKCQICEKMQGIPE